MNKKNIIFTLDAYKWDHESLYKDGFENNYANLLCRSDKVHKEAVVFGFQGDIKTWLTKPVTQEMLDEARETAIDCFGSDQCINYKSWQYIIDNLDGMIPLRIKSVEEGCIVPVGNVIMTVEATIDGFGWAASAFETLLQHGWYTTQVATRAFEIVRDIKASIIESSDNLETYKFMLCDFGQRGVTCMEQAGKGGSAVLLSTYSSDTMMAIPYAVNDYNADRTNLLKSVRAVEHAVTSGYGSTIEGEMDYLSTILNRHRDGILSMLTDTNCTERFIQKVVPEMKQEILNHHENGKGFVNKVIFRPDSDRWEGDTPHEQVLWIVEKLGETFGYSVNTKGKKVLHPAVGVIYGDALTQEKINVLYRHLIDNGWSSENCFVGCGGGLLQNGYYRDALATAFKASKQKFDGKWINVNKNTATKTSIGGKAKLFKEQDVINGGWNYKTIRDDHPLYHDVKDEMNVVFENGKMIHEVDFETVRANIGLWS